MIFSCFSLVRIIVRIFSSFYDCRSIIILVNVADNFTLLIKCNCFTKHLIILLLFAITFYVVTAFQSPTQVGRSHKEVAFADT